MPAPPIPKATGKPERMPAKRHTKVIIKPIITPSIPNIISHLHY